MDATARRLFTALLVTWPSHMRARVGEEALATFAARLRERRLEGRSPIPFILAESAGVLAAGVRMRVGTRGRTASALSNRSGSLMEVLMQDLRFAIRGMMRNPGFSTVVILVLALGIGLNTAIFSVLNATLLRPLPVESPERLVTIRESNPEKGWVTETAAPANMLDWHEGVEAFEGVAAHIGFAGSATITGEGEPEIVRAVEVTGNFFDVLGVEAALGRTLRDAETWNTEPPVVVLSDGFWTRRFGRSPGAIGRMLTINGGSHEVVGVMPPGLTFPSNEMDIWRPVRWDPANREQVFFRRAHYLNPVARLRAGVTLEQAYAQLQVVVRRLQEEYPATNRVMGAGIYPLQEFLTSDVRTQLLLVQGAVLLLLLVACANVGNLLLVRGLARQSEMALRAALGAGRRRIAAQVLTESFTLAVLGGLSGVVLGVVVTRALSGMLPARLAPLEGLGLDARVLAFAAVITAAAGAVFGLVPALSRQIALDGALRGSGRGGTASRRSLRAANLLIVSEVAVALVLVLGAGLLVRSFAALREVDPGFRIEDRLSVRVLLRSGYDTPDRVNVFFDELLSRLEDMPGVRGVALARTLPLAGQSYTTDFVVSGWAPDEFGAEVTHQSVSPSYLETLGVRLLAGRFLEEMDRADTEPVVVINQALAGRYFPGEDAVGRRMAFDRVPSESTTWYRIVGVIGDQHQESVGLAPRIEVYKTYWQEATSSMAVVVHSERAGVDVIEGVRAAVRDLDPDIPLAEVRTLDEIYRQSLRNERFVLVMIAAFAGLALLLAALGIYGVASQTARRRTAEIGIRVALGARRGDVVRLILRQALGPVGAGLALGLLGGLVLTRVMESVLFGVSPDDPLTFVAVPVLLACIAILASWLPARKATRVDPVTALR